MSILIKPIITEKATLDSELRNCFSFLVIALHLAYVGALLTNTLSEQSLMILALVAYVAYLINAAQFILKLRSARLQSNVGESYA